MMHQGRIFSRVTLEAKNKGIRALCTKQQRFETDSRKSDTRIVGLTPAIPDIPVTYLRFKRLDLCWFISTKTVPINHFHHNHQALCLLVSWSKSTIKTSAAVP